MYVVNHVSNSTTRVSYTLSVMHDGILYATLFYKKLQKLLKLYIIMNHQLNIVYFVLLSMYLEDTTVNVETCRISDELKQFRELRCNLLQCDNTQRYRLQQYITQHKNIPHNNQSAFLDSHFPLTACSSHASLNLCYISNTTFQIRSHNCSESENISRGCFSTAFSFFSKVCVCMYKFQLLNQLSDFHEICYHAIGIALVISCYQC